MKLSNPSKMPGYAFGLPAQRCQTGARLVNVPNSVCKGCYALKGNYRFSHVKTPRENNYQELMTALQTPETREQWIAQAVELISSHVTIAAPYFRWHDSGDIQSVEHLRMLIEVARRLPQVSFWLPTREYAILQELLFDEPDIPSNFVIRLSAHMLTSTITPPDHTQVAASSVGAGVGHLCPAKSQGGKCGDCRACWNPNVANVDYIKH